jgi:toxin ParE1/3/4
VARDFDRIRAHLEAHDSEQGEARAQAIAAALEALIHNPCIGRPRTDGLRELVIGREQQGCVAVYRYLEGLDLVIVLGLRHQREAGFYD